MTKIFAEKVYTGEIVLENQILACANGKIYTINDGHREEADKVVTCIAPGFFDIQVNGGAVYHFTASPNEDCLRDIDHACFLDGTAYVLPTLITSSRENIFKGIDATRTYLQKHKNTCVLGMHLEGPFINEKKRGAHLSRYIQKPTKQLVKEIIEHGKGVILQMTLAPEMFDEEILRLLLDSGIALSVGHTNATYAEAMHAFNLGIHQVTHLFNAMSPFLHRAPGVVGAAFDHQQVFTPLVLDGKHVDFAAAGIARKIKQEKFFLLSDALFLRKEKHSFQWETFDAQLINDEYINSEGNLAGANISLADAVRNAVVHLGVSVQEAIEMATYRPAKAVNQLHSIGKIAVGYPARFTVFDENLSNFKVLSTEEQSVILDNR